MQRLLRQEDLSDSCGALEKFSNTRNCSTKEGSFLRTEAWWKKLVSRSKHHTDGRRKPEASISAHQKGAINT